LNQKEIFMKPTVNMVGRLTRDVTNVFSNNDGNATRALFTVACNSYYKGTDGAKKESVDFVPCICWGGLVPIMTTWGLKGRQIQVHGTLETFQAAPNEDGKYPPTKIQVKVEQLQFLDKKPEGVEAPADNKAPGTSGAPEMDMNKLAELVAAKLLGPTNATGGAQTQTPPTDTDDASGQAEAAADAQAQAGGDLSSVT
jgi:single-stranded DNA-binding protein